MPANSVRSISEELNRLKKRDRIVAQIVLQARANPHVTWAEWADGLEAMRGDYVEMFLVSCGERVSETTMTETWPLVIAVIRSWAESDRRVGA